MPTPRSLLHLDGAQGSTIVVNDVTSDAAVAWSFEGGGSLTTTGPYVGSAMASLARGQLLSSKVVSPVGDWTLAFRIGQSYNADGGAITVVSQGLANERGCWALMMGGADLYLFSQVAGRQVEIDYSLVGRATAINAKILAGNAFVCVQYIRGALSVGLAGVDDTRVVKILEGVLPYSMVPSGAFRFNGRSAPGGGSAPMPDSGTSRIDEVVYQDGHPIWPTYPFARPIGEFSFAGHAKVAPAGVSAVGRIGTTQVGVAVRAIAAGLSSAGVVGVVAVCGDGAATLAGVVVNTSMGRVAVGAEVGVVAAGVDAHVLVGQVLGAGDATAMLEGVQGLGWVGGPSVDIGHAVDVGPSDWIRYVIPAERRFFTLAPEARNWTLNKP